MEKILGPNWLTTIGGILSAVGLALIAVPMSDAYKWIPPVLAAIGGAIVGGGAKSFNVHSTQTEVKVATEEKKVETTAAIADLKEKK